MICRGVVSGAVSDLAVWILDLASGALRCSEAMSAVVGASPVTREAWLGRVVDGDRDRFASALDAERPFDIEIELAPPGATSVRIRANRIERALVGTCELTEAATISRLVTTVSHDLNNPLAAALANVELIRDSLPPDSDLEGMVDDAQQALRRMRAIIAGLRRLAGTELPRQGAAESAAASKTESRVLIVDDEVLFTNVVHRVLREHHQLTICSNTDDAVARFEAGERFDAIVCDLMMPRIGGMGLYARVAELAPDQATRFIFVTAGTTTAAAQEFLSGRTNPKLEKPCDFKELRALVARVASAKSPA